MKGIENVESGSFLKMDGPELSSAIECIYH